MSEAIRHGEIFLALSEPPSAAREAHAQTVVREQIAALRALSSAPPEKGERIPSGWKLVPVEPTEEMWAAGYAAYEREMLKNRQNVSVAVSAKWKAMLAASPPPAKAEDGMREVDDAMVERAYEAQLDFIEASANAGNTITRRDSLRAALRAALAGGDTVSAEINSAWDADTLAAMPGYPWIPCPICKGIEGCDHAVPERARAALPSLVLPRQRS